MTPITKKQRARFNANTGCNIEEKKIEGKKVELCKPGRITEIQKNPYLSTVSTPKALLVSFYTLSFTERTRISSSGVVRLLLNVVMRILSSKLLR